MTHLKQPETIFAIEAVRSASQLVRQIQLEMVKKDATLTKTDLSPVTVADFASQALVGYLLAERFPNAPMVAEEASTLLRKPESAAALQAVTHHINLFLDNFPAKSVDHSQDVEQKREDGVALKIKAGRSAVSSNDVCNWIDTNRVDQAQRFWTLDPIDGTKGFLRGDQYVVALALVVNNQIQIGVLGCPNLVISTQNGALSFLREPGGDGSLVVAARGQGCWVAHLIATTQASSLETFQQLHVSNQTDIKKARVLRSFESGHTNVDQIDQFMENLGIHAEAIRMDSQAKYALLAAGQGEVILRLLSPTQPDYKEKIWDQAAGSLILEEAGGSITDLQGRSLDFSTGRTLLNNRGVLASNKKLHPTCLKTLEQILT